MSRVAAHSRPEPLADNTLLAGVDIAELLPVLAGRCLGTGPVRDLTLIRHGTHPVYGSTSHGAVFRVHPAGDLVEVNRTLAYVRELAAAGAPLLAPLTPTAQVDERFAVTAWPRCRPLPGAGDRLLGQALRELHSTSPLSALPLIDFTPTLTRRLDALDHLPAEYQDILRTKARQAQAVLAAVIGEQQRAGTAPSLLHGDAHAGNLMVHNGRVVFIDLDTLACGPREFDLVPAAVAHTRIHRNRSRWRALRTGYGDFDQDTVTRLAVVRETTMNTWLATRWGIDLYSRDELTRRLDTWDHPNPGDAGAWTAF